MSAQFSVGKGIRWAREKAGLTQEILGIRTGLTINFISRVENGKKGISFPHITRVAEVTGASIEAIVVMAGDPNDELVGKLQGVVTGFHPSQQSQNHPDPLKVMEWM